MMTGVVEVDFQFTLEYFEYDRIVASDILNYLFGLMHANFHGVGMS